MNITIRSVTRADFDELNKFYANALEVEHKGLASEEDIHELLREYKKEKWIWSEQSGGKSFVAVDEKDTIIGLLEGKYFDTKESIIFYFTLFPSETRNKKTSNRIS